MGLRKVIKGAVSAELVVTPLDRPVAVPSAPSAGAPIGAAPHTGS
jgi:hypothetical protein